MFRCAVRAGAGLKIRVHCVGDGAPWIVNQVDLTFGTQSSFLVDFYHLCQYLAPAGDKIAGGGNKAWIETQKQLLKESRTEEVIQGLRPFLEGDDVRDADASVRVSLHN